MRTVDRHLQNYDLGRYTEHMRAHARTLGVDEADIDDVVGDALVVACQQKQGRPPPEEVGRVILWLLALVEQQGRAYTTRRIRRAREALMEDPAAAGQAITDEHDPIRVCDLRDWILQAIPKVPEPLCSVVLACDAGDDKVRAFAKKHGINRKTAETRLSRGRAAFRKALLRLDEPKRRLGALLPFGFDLGPRTARLLRRAMQTIGGSFRLLPGMAVAAAILAITPRAPSAPAREPERSASTWQPVQIHAEPEPEAALPVPLVERQALSPHSPALRLASAPKPRRSEQAPVFVDPDLGHLMAAKVALRRGDAGKARALLDARASSADAKEREMLRSASHP
jgi:DNA-directed RNA polymerase specialized sigma24 family protein